MEHLQFFDKQIYERKVHLLCCEVLLFRLKGYTNQTPLLI